MTYPDARHYPEADKPFVQGLFNLARSAGLHYLEAYKWTGEAWERLCQLHREQPEQDGLWYFIDHCLEHGIPLIEPPSEDQDDEVQDG